MDLSLGLGDGDGFCIEGTTTTCVCLRSPLVDAVRVIERESMNNDEEPYTLTELVEDALVNFLREMGRLPKPYV